VAAADEVSVKVELQDKIEIEESKATDESVRSTRAFVPHRLRSAHTFAEEHC